MLDELREEMKNLALHLKTARWQRQQHQLLLANIPAGHALVTVDYAENYLCRHQNEVKSAHWNNKQVGLHPCIVVCTVQMS